MTIFLHKYFSVILFFLASFMKCDANYEALLFSRDRTGEIYDLKKIKESAQITPDILKLSSPTAIACAAKREKEEQFNQIHSFGKNSLFVRNTYEKNYSANHIDVQICEIPYKLSLIYDKVTNAFSFGFEMYYDKSEYADETFVDSKLEDYTVINDVYLRNQISPGTSTDTQKLKSHILHDETELGFIWIDSFQMKFNFEVNRLIHTSYSTAYVNRGLRECDNYDLGNGYFNDINIRDLYNKLYDDDNQKRMLEGVKLPTADLGDEYKEAACEFEHKCFAKWLSVPSELFYYPAGQSTSCSNLLTVPIWKSTVEDVLKKLDNFLYVFSQALGYPIGNITVFSGVHSVLELPTGSDGDQSKKMITLGKNDMPVPDVIYKFIKYKVEICDNPDSTQVENEDSGKKSCKSTLRAMIVVIHNNPYFDAKTDKICEDMCESLKWEEIQYKNSAHGRIKSKYIYCCSATDKDVRKKLGIQYEYGEDEKSNALSIDGELSLKQLPVYNYDEGMFEPQDAHELIVQMYEVFLEEGVLNPM